MEKIVGIYEKDFKTKKPNVQYRVGRVGEILPLQIGCKMMFAYESPLEGVLHTSPVVDWGESEYDVTVETENTVYYFEKLASNDSKPIIEF